MKSELKSEVDLVLDLKVEEENDTEMVPYPEQQCLESTNLFDSQSKSERTGVSTSSLNEKTESPLLLKSYQCRICSSLHPAINRTECCCSTCRKRFKTRDDVFLHFQKVHQEFSNTDIDCLIDQVEESVEFAEPLLFREGGTISLNSISLKRRNITCDMNGSVKISRTDLPSDSKAASSKGSTCSAVKSVISVVKSEPSSDNLSLESNPDGSKGCEMKIESDLVSDIKVEKVELVSEIKVEVI